MRMVRSEFFEAAAQRAVATRNHNPFGVFHIEGVLELVRSAPGPLVLEYATTGGMRFRDVPVRLFGCSLPSRLFNATSLAEKLLAFDLPDEVVLKIQNDQVRALNRLGIATIVMGEPVREDSERDEKRQPPMSWAGGTVTTIDGGDWEAFVATIEAVADAELHAQEVRFLNCPSGMPAIFKVEGNRLLVQIDRNLEERLRKNWADALMRRELMRRHEPSPFDTFM